MWEILYAQMKKLPPLQKPKNPAVAIVVGFLTGGVGLGIYLRSFVDVLIPILLFIGVSVFCQEAAALGAALGPTVVAIYGYARVQESNERLAHQRHANEQSTNELLAQQSA
jgi:hypothetical protein